MRAWGLHSSISAAARSFSIRSAYPSLTWQTWQAQQCVPCTTTIPQTCLQHSCRSLYQQAAFDQESIQLTCSKPDLSKMHNLITGHMHCSSESPSVNRRPWSLITDYIQKEQALSVGTMQAGPILFCPARRALHACRLC